MTSVRSPCSVSSLAAQPPVIPDPTTIASYCSLRCGDIEEDLSGRTERAVRRVRSGGPAATDLGERNAALEPARYLGVTQLLRRAELRGVVADDRQLLHRAEERQHHRPPRARIGSPRRRNPSSAALGLL